MGCIISFCRCKKQEEQDNQEKKELKQNEIINVINVDEMQKITDSFYQAGGVSKTKEDLLKIEKSLEEKEKKLKEREKILKENEEKLSGEREKGEKEKEEREKRQKDLNEKGKKLSEKEKEFESKKNSLKVKEDKLNGEKKELSEKGKDISKRENALIERENQFNIKVVSKENEIKEKEKNLKNELLKLEREKQLIKIEKENNKKEKEKNEFDKQNFEKLKQLEKLPILIGLDNIGATCYMNATLQSFSNTEEFTDYFLIKFKYNENDQTKIISNEFYKLLINLHHRNSGKKSYSPNDFKTILSQENPLFQGIQANDSKDLINFLLERLHKELNAAKNEEYGNYNINQLNEMEVLNNFLQEFQNNYKSIISDLFYGVLETKSQCCGCKNIKYNFQIFSFLEFPLEQVNIYCYQNGKRNFINSNGKNADVDLYECFDYYQKIDVMTGDNQMYCNICNNTFDSLYSTSLFSGPKYLIIILNRGKNAVYECKVHFPEQLNLINYISYKNGVTVYKLYAVISHYGPSSMSGHFMAYCRNKKDNNWYLYNDSIVSLCNKPYQYNDGMPYILFYKSA